MAQGRLDSVAVQVRRLFGEGTVTGLSERQLLERFVNRRDPAAYEAIVTRHGPMVLGVCRRWLDDPNDADDAFQATFLILVRRAQDLRDRDLLANWLYGVATRVARRARQQAARRQERERLAGQARASAEEVRTADDLRAELHEELARLPGSYRQAVVLCYLEGRSHEEAACELGWPIGTVKGRLARARDLLRDRLIRRGLAVPTAVVIAALKADAATLVPAALREATIQAAVSTLGNAVAAGLISSTVLTLTQEVARTMILPKMLTYGIVGAIVTGAGLAGAAYSQSGGPGSAAAGAPKPAQAAPVTGGGGSTAPAVDNLATLEKARTEAARASYEANLNYFMVGQITIDRVIAASERLMLAERESAPSEARKRAANQEHVKRMESLVGRQKEFVPLGKTSAPDFQEAEVALAEARLTLARKSSPPQAPIGGMSSGAGMMGGPGMTAGMPGGYGGGMPGGSGSGGMMPGGPTAAAAPAGLPTWMSDSVRTGGFDGSIDEKLAARLIPASRKFGRVIDDDPRSLAIQKKLAMICSMPFQEPTSLRDVVDHIRTVTADEEFFPKGIPIYLDMNGLLEANNIKEEDPVRLELEGVALRTCLRLMLQQIGLSYVVKEGILFVSGPKGLLDEIERDPE